MKTKILIMGAPVLLTLMYCNTMFNENEPIVNKPEEALDCFLRTRMDGYPPYL